MRHASAAPSASGPPREDGFVMIFVLFMLFTISITAVTGYLVVSSEFSLSNHAKEGAEVIAVAHGGMQQFLAEQTGVVGDSVVYSIGLGDAIVTSRKLTEQDSLNHLYYLRSEGMLNDNQNPGRSGRQEGRRGVRVAPTESAGSPRGGDSLRRRDRRRRRRRDRRS